MHLELPIRLERRVQLWSYQVTHSVLLMRANPRPGVSTRIDLMFREVKEISIKYRYEDLTVSVIDPALAIARLELEEKVVANRYVFALTPGLGKPGYVLAGSLFMAEDNLSDGEPTAIGNPDLAGHVIREAEYR